MQLTWVSDFALAQTWWSVVLVLLHVFKAIKAKLPRVKAASIFADNARCYACNDLYANLRGLLSALEIQLWLFAHSEASAGRTPLDGHFGFTKRRIRSMVACGRPDNEKPATTGKDGRSLARLTLCKHRELARLRNYSIASVSSFHRRATTVWGWCTWMQLQN